MKKWIKCQCSFHLCLSFSSASASEERTGDNADALHNPPEVEQPTGIDRPEPVSTGSVNDDLQHKALSSLVPAQGKTEIGSSLASGGAGLMKPGSDTPTLPGRAKKGTLPASEEEGEPSTPDVVNATTSKGDTPASKMQTPTTKKDPPSSKDDTPIPKQDIATPKEDPPTLKEDPPTPKEDPPTPKEDPPTPKEDPPTPKEDPPTPKEDPPTPKEDPPPPAKTQDLLESWKGCMLSDCQSTCVSVRFLCYRTGRSSSKWLAVRTHSHTVCVRECACMHVHCTPAQTWHRAVART